MPCSCDLRRADSYRMESPTIDADGRVTVVARAAGELHYPLRNAIERVDAATLEDGIASLIGRNVERGHNGPVIGRIETARVDGDRIICGLVITDPHARQDIADGNLNEASADYVIGALDSDGTQRGPFVYTALALIPPGVSRCGPTCSIERPEHRADHALGFPGMAKIKIAGKDYEAGSAEAAEAMSAEARRMDADGALLAGLRRERSARIRTDAKRAGAVSRADADDNQVMIDVIAKVFPSVDVSGQTPDYVAGAFAVAIASLLEEKAEASGKMPPDGAKPGAAPPPADGAAAARADAHESRASGAKSPAEAAPGIAPDVLARQNMIRKGQNLKPSTPTEA